MKTDRAPVSFRRTGVVLTVFLVLWASDARAACGSTDVSCWINLVKKMAKDVDSLKNDVIPAVKTTLKDVETGVSEVETTFSELESGSTEIIGEFKAASDAVEKSAGEPVTQFFALSDDLVTRLTNEWAYLTSELEHESADYVAFVGSDGSCTAVCDAFRRDLGEMIRRIGTVTESGADYLKGQLDASGSSPLAFARTFDTDSLAQKIETAPAILVYPVHVALDGIAGASLVTRESARFPYPDIPPRSPRATCTGGGYCGVINAVHDGLDRIEHSFSQLGQTAQGKRASATWPPPCDGMDLDSATTDLARALLVYGAIQTILSVPLQSAGLAGLDTVVSPGADVAASVEASFQARPLRQIGHGLRMVGDPPLTAGDILLSRIGDCRNRLNAQFLLCQTIKGDDCKTRVLGGEVFGF